MPRMTNPQRKADQRAHERSKAKKREVKRRLRKQGKLRDQ